MILDLESSLEQTSFFAKSLKAFDDCCPDFEETCVDKSCLKQKGNVLRFSILK